MKALIFAAGLGTRLKPITDSLPKALVPINGKPLLEHVILKLKSFGFDQIIINIHHFPDLIIDFLRQHNDFGIRITVSDERNLLLDTGGGIRNASWFFDDEKPFLIHNVDILSDINLKELYDTHVSNNSLATLAVSERDTLRYLLFDENNRLQGWTNISTHEVKPPQLHHIAGYTKLAFSGVQVVSTDIFDFMMPYGKKFSIMDFYLDHVYSLHISGFKSNNNRILDVGKINVLDEAEEFINYLDSRSRDGK